MPLSARRLFSGIFLFCWLACALVAQQTPDPTAQPGNIVERIDAYRTEPGTGILIFNVLAERTKTHLDRQALLTRVNLSDYSATWANHLRRHVLTVTSSPTESEYYVGSHLPRTKHRQRNVCLPIPLSVNPEEAPAYV